jgi:DnaJ family protein C protein 17
MAVDKATRKLQREDRQVRLKWSRKKVVGGIHTVQSLTAIMKDFGQVEEVEMLGSKGNAALITFVHESSCKSCVYAYRTSETMRATFVGRKKHQDNMHEVDDNSMVAGSSQHSETLEERKLRQAAERERLMRQMELEEEGANTSSQAQQFPNRTTERQDDNDVQPPQKKSSFPPDFPGRAKEATSPFELLEKYEKLLFDRIDKLKS